MIFRDWKRTSHAASLCASGVSRADLPTRKAVAMNIGLAMEPLLVLLAYAISILFFGALLYFFIKLAVKHGIEEAFDKLRKDGKI